MHLPRKGFLLGLHNSGSNVNHSSTGKIHEANDIARNMCIIYLYTDDKSGFFTVRGTERLDRTVTTGGTLAMPSPECLLNNVVPCSVSCGSVAAD